MNKITNIYQQIDLIVDLHKTVANCFDSEFTAVINGHKVTISDARLQVGAFANNVVAFNWFKVHGFASPKAEVEIWASDLAALYNDATKSKQELNKKKPNNKYALAHLPLPRCKDLKKYLDPNYTKQIDEIINVIGKVLSNGGTEFRYKYYEAHS